MQLNKNTIILLLLLFLVLRGGGIGPSSAPFPTDKLSVLVVEETEDRDDYLPSQVSAMESTIWREYVSGKGGEYRMLEPGADLSKELPWVSAAMVVKRDSLPWLVVSDGKRGSSGPLPENLEHLLVKLKETGGE